ncbi:hypothetical protein [Bradyrhizobium erythrophlei]|uniref:Uncharacterized protein n=1 Tax=Bradyrhizobium erythrophlei TaxID=1437360 RepID=A0A1H4NI39_9BRAD|nr:hypothetical protein [Bradyrhizobium erythrophlei]SEB94881.1 hypothetical protein SAMN05444164_0637 [Bradyrhizobium erythrophlei]
MREPTWPGIATAVALLWIFATVAWLGIAGPIWHATNSASPDAWIGFAGNALAALVALLAAIVAGIAAYRTVVPMQRQLSELIHQNNSAHYERLRQRAADVVDLAMLIERANADLEVFDRSLSLAGLGAHEGRQTAFERLEASIIAVNSSRRLVWGDENAQSLLRYYADNCLRAATVARTGLLGSRTPFSRDEWKTAKEIAFQGGVALYARSRLEVDMISKEVAALEPTVFRRQPLSQLWQGDYPGPDKLAAMYAGMVDIAKAKTPRS